MTPAKPKRIAKRRLTSGKHPLARVTALACVLGLVASASPALAEDEEAEEEVSSLGSDPTLGLDPTTPQGGALPGGTTPAYGQASEGAGDWRFDFHGLLIAPLRVGINERVDKQPGESNTVLHAPPVVPDDLETFSHTGVVPTPYTQLNFSYGTSVVTGNVSVLARQATVAAGFFDPPSQAGINDVYLAIRPDLGLSNTLFKVNVGAFTNRYGSMGEYDEGRYGTPLIARTNGVGENIIAAYSFGSVQVMLEQGIQGQSNKASVSVSPDGWNDFADPNVGASFVNHVHAGLGFGGFGTLGLHYMHAWSQDDTGTGTLAPDGSIDILGADLRLSMGRFGHFYLAGSRVDAEYVGTVGRIVEVLNTKGGPGLIDNYLGDDSDGNGNLTIVGGQYDLSVGRLVSYPVRFNADGPDLVVSGFGMMALVNSDDADYDDITMLKYGTEITYSPLSWLAMAFRFDQVAPNMDNQRFSFAVLSPRLIFHTDWTSTDQIVLGYSNWRNGSLTTVRDGYPPKPDVTIVPDEHMVSLSANMWW